MMRQSALMLVRLGLVLLALAVLVRPIPMPSRADLVADDLAIVASLAVVVVGAVCARFTREA
jgi:hypothetical protein